MRLNRRDFLHLEAGAITLAGDELASAAAAADRGTGPAPPRPTG